MGLVYLPTWMVDLYGKCMVNDGKCRWIYHTWILWDIYTCFLTYLLWCIKISNTIWEVEGPERWKNLQLPGWIKHTAPKVILSSKIVASILRKVWFHIHQIWMKHTNKSMTFESPNALFQEWIWWPCPTDQFLKSSFGDSMPKKRVSQRGFRGSTSPHK